MTVISLEELEDGAFYVVWDNEDGGMTIAQADLVSDTEAKCLWNIMYYPTTVPYEMFSPIYKVFDPSDFEDTDLEGAIELFWNQMRETHG
ncbi:hypothetical protein [Vibrio phage V-YDF132]|nr:hypothetical protein [Vibrio phage V-YDF132]